MTIKIDMVRFKNASKKLLSEMNSVTKLSEMQELLSRALGFRNFQSLCKQLNSENEPFKISEHFKRKNSDEIWHEFFANKNIEKNTENSVDIWYFRGKNLLVQVLDINKVLFEKSVMDFNFSSICLLCFNFEYLYEIVQLTYFDKKSKLFPTLGKDDFAQISLKPLYSVPGICTIGDKEFIKEKWHEGIMMLFQLVKDYKVVEMLDENIIVEFKYKVFTHRLIKIGYNDNPLSSSEYAIFEILMKN